MHRDPCSTTLQRTFRDRQYKHACDALHFTVLAGCMSYALSLTQFANGFCCIDSDDAGDANVAEDSDPGTSPQMEPVVITEISKRENLG